MENTNNNGAAAEAKREYRPIFNATITPKTIETKVGSNGKDYLLMTGATVAFNGKTQERTVMAFGKSVADVDGMLTANEPVTLAVQFDGGSVRIVGQVREKEAAAA